MLEERAKETEKQPRRRRRILTLLIVLAIGASIAWFARARIASSLVKSAASRIAGVDVSWTTFDVAGLSHARIEGLRVHALDEKSAIRSLEIDTLDVAVEPWKLVREGLSGLRSLHGSGVRGAYHVKPGDGAAHAPSDGAFAWPVALPEVRLDDVDFSVLFPEARRLSLRGGMARIEPVGTKARLAIDVAHLAWSAPGLELDHPLRIDAAYDAGRFDIERFEWDSRFVLNHGSADLSQAAAGRSSFALDVSALDGRASVAGHLEQGVLKLDVTTSAIDLRAGMETFAPGADIELAARVAIVGHASMRLDDPLRANAVVDLDASDVDILGVRFDTLVGRVSAKDGLVEADDVFAVRRANVIALDFARLDFVPWDGCTALERLFASATADIGSLPTFLREVVRETPNVDVDPAEIPPIGLRATLAGGNVTGDVVSAHLRIAPLVKLFSDTHAVSQNPREEISTHAPATDAAPKDVLSTLYGDVDLRAHVVLPIEDVRRTRGTADLDARDVEVLSRRFELLRGRVSLDEHALRAADVLVVSGGNVVEIPFAEWPSGDWTRCDALEHAIARVSVEWTDIPSLVRDARDTDVLARLPPHRLTFKAALFDDGLSIDSGEFVTEGNSFRIEAGRVPLGSDLRAIVHDPQLDLDLAVRFDEIESVWRVLEASLPKIAETPSGAVQGRVRIRGHRDGPRGRLALRAQHVSIGEARFDEANLRADVDAEALSVETLEAVTSLGSLSAHGRWTFADRRLEGVRVEADLVDLERVAPGRLPTGAVHLSAEVDGKLNELDGFVRFDAEDLSWNGVRIENAALEARATKGKIAIAELSGKSGPFAARLAGDVEALDVDARRWRLDLSRLDLDVEGSRMSLAHPARFEAGRADFSVDGLLLAGAEGELSASVSLASGMTCADVRVRGVALEALLEHFDVGLPTATRVDMELHVEREGDVVRATTQGTLTSVLGTTARALAPAGETSSETSPTSPETANAAAQDKPVLRVPSTNLASDRPSIEAGSCALSWNATLENRRLTLDSIEFNASTAGDNSVFVSAGGFAPLDLFGPTVLCDGPLELRATASLDELALLPISARFGGVRGAVRADLDWHGSWTRILGALSFSAENLAWRAFDAASDIGPCSIDGAVDFGPTIALRNVHATLPGDASVDVSGQIATPVDLRAIASGHFDELLAAELSLDARLSAVDLAPIGKHVPALRRTGGRVTANALVRGTLAAPKLEGSASLDQGEIRTMTSLPALSNVHADVRFDGAVLEIQRLDGELGGAPFTMRGAATLFGPNESIDVTIVGQSLLLYRQTDVSVRADAELRLHGPLDALELSGDIALQNSRYARKFDFLAIPRRSAPTPGRRGFELFSLREPPFDQMRFDIRVKSATPFEVANNIARGKLRPDLTLAGTGELPELRGTVYIEPSRVLLPSGTLQVRSGRVEFRLDQPEIPILDIQAHTRLQGYDIDINVSGPYDDPRVDFSSVPPLSREDLALLVITGRPPGNGLSLATGQRAAIDVAVYIARDVAAAWLGGDEATAESFAERLEVIVGSDTTKSGADAVLVRMRLTGKLAERADALYLTGERDIYDFYNFGLRFVFTFQ